MVSLPERVSFLLFSCLLFTRSTLCILLVEQQPCHRETLLVVAVMTHFGAEASTVARLSSYGGADNKKLSQPCTTSDDTW